jgi:penicillin-binding protein 1A
VAAFSAGLLRAVAAQIPALDPARAAKTQANTYIYADDGKSVLAVLRGSQARVIVPYDQISPWMLHAIVAIEDKRFYEHHGVDVRGILRAAWNDVRGRPVQGGSTITQQFVKDQLTGSAETFGRKLRDAALAWELEQKWSKDQILAAYLNTIYLDNGAYGVEEAARVYFGEDASKLDPAQAALLAGIPEDPTLWDPVAHQNLARARRNLVLRQMLDQGYLTQDQYKTAIGEKMPDPRSVHLPGTLQSSRAPYFANFVTNQLLEHYGAADKVFGGGLKVTTTIDLGLQKLAQQAVSKVLPPSIGPAAALVAIDAHTGAVLAMVGGRNFHQSQFNLAAQGERQPGSAFKPFVLAAALRDGISPSTTLVSKPVSIFIGNKLWNVDNYEDEYLGPIDLDTAIAVSDNSVFAQLTNIVGPRSVEAAAKAMGITSPLQPYFAIGLGAEPATPVEMARAYTTLADGGYRIDESLGGINDQPRAIESITSSGGDVLENSAVPKQVLNGNNAAIENQMLEGVITSGTGTAAALPGRTVAGKTGTTENYGDAWFVGFTPDIVTAVWVGYPDKLVPMLTQFHGGPVVGGSYPAEIWKAFMLKAVRYLDLPVDSFTEPTIPYSSSATVLYRDGKLEQDNGNCRNTNVVEFFSGYTPAAVANCKPNEVDVPSVLGMTYASAKARLSLQPLLTSVAYRAAKPGQRVGLVVDQKPRKGTLSSYDKVQLVLSRATHGVVPKLVGLTLGRAQAALARLELPVEVKGAATGRVVAQQPPSGVAAGPGVRVVLTVAARKAG